jgi:hypothetical protein
MHDLGIIPEKARGWRYRPAVGVSGEKWLRPGFNDSGWLRGVGPFYLDRELKDQLVAAGGKSPAPAGAAINFRFEFEISREMLRDNAEFKLEVISMAPSVRVWLNGEELTADDKPKRGRREYTLPQPLVVNGSATEKKVHLRRGANALAAQVTPTANASETLLQARLDPVRRPDLPEGVDERVAEEITEKLVTQNAVVCDLCSQQYGRVPACVNACPHDAAMRVNARFEFPVR